MSSGNGKTSGQALADRHVCGWVVGQGLAVRTGWVGGTPRSGVQARLRGLSAGGPARRPARPLGCFGRVGPPGHTTCQARTVHRPVRPITSGSVAAELQHHQNNLRRDRTQRYRMFGALRHGACLARGVPSAQPARPMTWVDRRRCDSSMAHGAWKRSMAEPGEAARKGDPGGTQRHTTTERRRASAGGCRGAAGVARREPPARSTRMNRPQGGTIPRRSHANDRPVRRFVGDSRHALDAPCTRTHDGLSASADMPFRVRDQDSNSRSSSRNLVRSRWSQSAKSSGFSPACPTSCRRIRSDAWSWLFALSMSSR